MEACSDIASIFCLFLQLSTLVCLDAADVCTIEGDVRLVGQDSNNNITEGRVEICRDGEWGTICDYLWSTPDAIVVCRQLNLTTDYAVALPLYGGGSGPIHYSEFQCTGSETHLVNCPASKVPDNNYCVHVEDSGVRCPSEPECVETDIRLANGQTSDDGRVELCLRGHWGSVCDDRWDTRDATVVCKQLGYNGPSYPLSSHGIDDPLTFHVDDVHCIGNESKLSECAHLGFGVHNCDWRFEEAGVVCTNNTCEHGTVHLVGSDDVSRGRVEYCYEGNWYSLCAKGWDEDETNIVCETLGYTSDIHVTSNFGRGNSPILSKIIKCSSSDETLSHCVTTDVDVSECQNVVGVICEAPCLSNGCKNCSSSTCTVRSADCSCYADCYEFGDCCPDVAHVKNCTVSECETGEIRLVGGVTNSSGRLEFCANGIWGRICNRFRYWGPDNARVVCRQLGFSADSAYLIDDVSIFGKSERSPVLGGVHCIGTEPELLECSHLSIGYHHCISTSPDIAISCYDERTSCEEGDVSLRDGTDPSNGRVEICQHRTWGAVCSDEWDDNAVRVVCGQLFYNPEDARAMEGFGNDAKVPVFFGTVTCNGTEINITECRDTTATDECSAIAGVTCRKSSNAKRCDGGPQEHTVTEETRFGVCEENTGKADICKSVRSLGVDYVYISNTFDSQVYLSDLLNNVSSVLATHEKDCVELVSRVICHYYLPLCGDIHKKPLPPTSLCQEECLHVQSKCGPTWKAIELAFGHDKFIECNDTSRLLFPVPNCCTGAGIVPTTPNSNGGALAGIVVGILMFIILAVVPVVVILLVIKYRNIHRNKLLDRIQMDIMAMPGQAQHALNSDDNQNFKETTDYGLEYEPEDKNELFEASNSDSNPYSVARPSGTTNTESGRSLHVPLYRPRVPSHYLRELTLGRFIVKQGDITLLDCIGEGEFGIVYTARLSAHGTHNKEVAVKTLKGEFDQVDVERFVEESLKMSRFKHSHVMGLIGVCLDAGSAPFIIMPYMANGSLLKYLKRERKKLILSEDDDEDEINTVCKRLTVICSQIASGMEYLAAEKYVHRDLAARNCMIDTHFLIKITDFGLSEDVFVRNYFRQGSAEEVVKLPVKWMAPESLSDGHFSEKSDVWSYGVTMWEIFSGGKAPYPGTDPLTLIQRLEEGERMPKPYNTACTDEVYIMMMKCWKMAPDDRPTFKEIYSNISKYIERMAGYLEMGFNPFAAGEEVKSAVGGEEEGEGECGVAIQVIPASVLLDGTHTNFADNTD